LSQPSHNDLILDQFMRQATPFSTASPITDVAALKLIIEMAGTAATDTVLDVACGGGVVACAFAPRVKHVTGIDMTPAMLARSANYANELGLTNLTWQQGDVTSLPFKDGAFSIVFTRFSLHHFLDPLAVLKEMVRVCAVGGALWCAICMPRPIQLRPRLGTGLRACAIHRMCAACHYLS
jgi:ubiquinone/menaquinone biosynthesis C-methylase UbiE